MIVWVVGDSAIIIKHFGPFEQRGQTLSKLSRIRGVIDHAGVIYDSWCHAWSRIVTTSRNCIYHHHHHHHTSGVLFPGRLSPSETFSGPVKAREMSRTRALLRKASASNSAQVYDDMVILMLQHNIEKLFNSCKYATWNVRAVATMKTSSRARPTLVVP